MGERKGAYKALVERPEGRRPLERHRPRWAVGVKMDLREVDWGGGGSTDRINMAKNRDRWRALVNAVMNLRLP
jgi:hypothetical protein